MKLKKKITKRIFAIGMSSVIIFSSHIAKCVINYDPVVAYVRSVVNNMRNNNNNLQQANRLEGIINKL